MAKYLVPWSGGLDSTSLICQLLGKGHRVEALYTDINDNEQDARQLNAVKIMQKQYFKNYDFSLIIDQNKGLGLSAVFRQNVICLQQVPVHIFNIIKHIDGHDFVAMAYVMNDDAISFLCDIKKIYDSYQGIANNRLPKLQFPLSKMPKHILYESLPRELKAHITWCEGTEDNCGKCSSCKRMSDLIASETNVSSKEDTISTANMLL